MSEDAGMSTDCIGAVATISKSDPSGSHGGTGERDRRSRKKRLQLSCSECREKKLSCDRDLPCQRCVRTGRPEKCSFETGTKTGNRYIQQQLQAQRNNEEIRDLRAEVAELRKLLSTNQPQDKFESKSQRDTKSHTSELISTAGDDYTSQSTMLSNERPVALQSLVEVVKTELPVSDSREKSAGYYQHTLMQSFFEVPQLFPFIRETTDEWLHPLGVHLRKNKPAKNDCTTHDRSQLDALLPPEGDTDVLVAFYIEHFEHLHRIVHVPVFRKQYAAFWDSETTREPAMIVLVLSMISMSAGVPINGDHPTSVLSKYSNMPTRWISACDDWLKQQGSKNSKVEHYQSSCLVYLAKRINVIRKKRFWKEAGSLLQDAILDGLHRESCSTMDNPYTREMKRRIWAVIREVNLQTTFEYKFPTLLHNLDCNVAAPSNINDEDFDEQSKELPSPEPRDRYIRTSYQDQSSRSWALRLAISRAIQSPKAFDYYQVLRYTHEITQAIQDIPAWTKEGIDDEFNLERSALSSAFLHFQLKECLLAIHRPFLQRDNGKYWLSQNFCYQTSRDILLSNKRLAALGIGSLSLLREDLLLGSLCLTHVTILQAKGSSNVIMEGAESTIGLLEYCLPLMEDRYLHTLHGEPMCFLSMYAAIMLLKIRTGKLSWQTAKSACARSFLDLNYKHIARHGQKSPSAQENGGNQDSNGADLILPSDTSLTALPTLRWSEADFADVLSQSNGLELGSENMWENWESAWRSE